MVCRTNKRTFRQSLGFLSQWYISALVILQEWCTAAPGTEGPTAELLYQCRGGSLAGHQCGGCGDTRNSCGYYAGKSCPACSYVCLSAIKAVLHVP